ncbi:MAG: protein kinase, partial [Planctomycetota bacterium]
EFLKLTRESRSNSTQHRSSRYEFREQVGHGGVGSVWRVFDRHSQRPLAIKVLHDRFRLDAAANKRLHREALLTGSLQHPGVPPVHDHGQLDDAATFFAMKLVAGKTLAELLQNDQEPQDRDALIGIFEQVCQVIAYAHARGVIHRDLKPHNVMVGQFGEVQVMDWGMAKQLDRTDDFVGSVSSAMDPRCASDGDTVTTSDDPSWNGHADRSLTAAGDVMGTPAYMSPEQARGDLANVDARSDVFGLGAMLFEILSGRRLYQATGAMEIIQQAVQCKVADSLESLDRVAGQEDLVELCRKCLSADPSLRPSHAGDVADAVAQHARGTQQRLRQAEADRQSAQVRAQEESKRRRVLAGTALTVALISSAGVAGVAYQWKQAVNANQRSVEALELADQRRRQAQQVVDEFLTEVADSEGELARNPGSATIRRQLLQKAQGYYEQFLHDSGDDPSVRRQAASAHMRLGEITQVLSPGDQEAIRQYESAIVLNQQCVDDGDDFTAIQREICRAQLQIGNAHLAASRLDQAESAYQQARQTASDLLASDRHDQDLLSLARATHNTATVKARLGHKEDALQLFEQAITIADPLLTTHGDDADYVQNISNMYTNAAMHLGFKMRRWEPSLRYGEISLSLRERLLALRPNDHRYQNALATGLNNLGLSLVQNRRADESLVAFERAAKIREALIAEHPAIPEYADKLCNTYNNLGTLSYKLGKPEAAVDYYRKVVRTYQPLIRKHPQVVKYAETALEALISIASLRPDNPEAIAVMRDAIQLYVGLLKQRPDSLSYAAHRTLYLAVLPDTPPEALVQQSKRITLQNRSPRYQAARALALYRNGRFALARQHAEALAPDRRDAIAHLVAALVQHQLNDTEAAEKSFQLGTSKMRKRSPDFVELMLKREYEQRARDHDEVGR